MEEKKIVNFFQIFPRFWNFGALFLKKGSLEFAHICSTCGPDLPRARHALRFGVYFRQGLPRKKVRCAAAARARRLLESSESSAEQKVSPKPKGQIGTLCVSGKLKTM